jgi:GT2 family glycosyltransferase
VKRQIFEKLHGFDISLKISYQDVDLCLRAAAAGYRTVYTPFALLYHHESASTGKRTNEGEERLFKERWREKYPCDPFYNPNFPADRADFRLSCD